MKKRTRKSLLKASQPVKKQLSDIEVLSQGSYKLSFQRLAEGYYKNKINFRMVLGRKSFACFQNNVPLMNIDLNQVKDDSYSLSHYHTLAKGMVYHETGHLLFTDFKVLHENANHVRKLTTEVKEVASRYHNADEDDKPDIEIELKDKIFDYVMAVNLPVTLNSFEDSSIERSMCEFGKDENGCINFMREVLYNSDTKSIQELLNNNTILLDEEGWDDNTYDAIISEARHYACLGYKRPVDMQIIEELFEKTEVHKIKDLATYARFSAKNTAERNDVAVVFMNLCKPIFEKISEKLANSYMKNMEKTEDLIDNMSNNANNYAKNTSGSNNTDEDDGTLPSSSGAPQQQTKYNLELPDELKEKLNQAAQERSQNTGEGIDSEESEVSKEKSMPSQKDLSDEAENDMNEVLRKAKKTFQKQEEDKQEDTILNHPNVRAGEGRCHKGVDLELFDFNDIDTIMDGYSYEGEDALEIIKKDSIDTHVNILVKKMKKILMQRSQDFVSKGRFEGKIDGSGLYRLHTDLQVFEKKTAGQKNKVRFAILVDASGSMYGEGLRNAILGCYMVSKAAQKLKIPFAVYSHNDCWAVNITKFIDYKNCRQKDILNNLFYMSTDGSNRDGLAIYHVCRELAKAAKPDEELYFIILSDGQPNSTNYGGQLAIDDMQEIMNFNKKHFGINSIGIGLGLDFDYAETVGKIYDNAVIVDEPEQLPNEMFKILKKIVRLN